MDRDNGTSIFSVEERPVPTDGLPGEHPWPVQKYPIKPLPLSHQVFTDADITDLSPGSHACVLEQYKKYKTDNKFAPPDTTGILLFGYSGGAEPGGNAVSPDGVPYQNSNDDPWIIKLTDTATRNREFTSLSTGNILYLMNCAVCHGQDKKGVGTEFPSLVSIEKKRTINEIQKILKTGDGRMPPFQWLSDEKRTSIAHYLLNIPSNIKPPAFSEFGATASTRQINDNEFGFKPAYVNKVWKKLTDQNGYPGIKPPWGTFNAIDLKTTMLLLR